METRDHRNAVAAQAEKADQKGGKGKTDEPKVKDRPREYGVIFARYAIVGARTHPDLQQVRAEHSQKELAENFEKEQAERDKRDKAAEAEFKSKKDAADKKAETDKANASRVHA